MSTFSSTQLQTLRDPLRIPLSFSARNHLHRNG